MQIKERIRRYQISQSVGVQLTDVCVALSSSVELSDDGNVEALHELFPDLRPETVAEGKTDAMLSIGGLGRLSQQVAGNLSNVLRGLFTLHMVMNWDSAHSFNNDFNDDTVKICSNKAFYNIILLYLIE
jgi:hypothetical protein